MKKVLAEIISYIFHPVVFAFLLPFIIIYEFRENPLYALKWTVFSSFFIGVVVFLILFQIRKGRYSDVDISKREERYSFYEILYFLVFLYFVAAVFLKGIFFPLSIIAFGVMMGIVIFNFANYFLKASVHTAVACAYVTTLAIIYGGKALLFTFWIVPLVVWARLYLKKHSIWEAIAGGAIGTSITLITFLIGKIFL